MAQNRLVRVKDLSGSGIENGPTASGLSFNSPWHFSLDSSGRIYVADRDNNRIIRMDDVAGSGWKAFSGGLALPGCQASPGCVVSPTVDSAGRIYVTAGRLVRIDDMDGSGWTTLGPTPSGPGSFNNPKVLIFDQQGRMIVSDTDHHRIVRFNDMQGTGWTTFGSYGSDIGQFNRPEGLAIDSLGRIYVAGHSNNNIVRIDDMTGAGWIAFGSGSRGSEVGQFSEPHDIKVDTLGRIYVADTGNHRIVRMNDMTGAGWIAFGVPGGPYNQLSAPKGIHVLGSGPDLLYRSVFPQVTIGGGNRTSLIGVNTGTGAVNAEVSLAKSDGTPFQVTVDGQSANRFERTITPMGTMHLTAMSTGTKTNGFAKLQSGDALNGMALLQTATGSTVVSEAGVRLSPSTKHFTVYVDNMNNARSGYTLTNFGTSGAQLDMTLRDKNGATLETATVTVGQGSVPQLSEFASQRFPAHALAGFEGSIEFNSRSGASVVSDGPGWYVGALALRYDNSASDVFTAMPILANEIGTTFYYPHIADGGTYQTNFILLNPTTTATTATLEFFGDDGTALSLGIGGVQRTTYSVPLPPKGVDHFVTDGTSPEAKMGWVRVMSPVPIGGSAIFQRVVDGRIVSEAAVSPAPPAAHFTAHVDTRGSTQSGLAVCNPNKFSVAATFNVRDASGQIIASTMRTLEAFAHVALLTDVKELEGTLEIQTNGAPLSGVGLRYDNPNGTVFTTMPVITIPSS